MREDEATVGDAKEEKSAHGTITLESFLDRLGLEGEARIIVKNTIGAGFRDVPGEAVAMCLAMVNNYQERRISFAALCDVVGTLLSGHHRGTVERIADMMLSGHLELDPVSAAIG